MNFHTAIIVITSLALSLAAGTCVLADDRYDDQQPAERFKLRIGGFLIDRFDTTARFDSTQYPIGTLIDLEEDFNVDTSETVLRIDGFYRFNNRHRIDQSRSQQGSGLSLVAAVARMHNATLEFGDNQPGLIAKLHFSNTD